MATEFLVPNGDDSGWDSGTFADVDNGGLAPSSPGAGPTDGAFVAISGTGKEGTTMTFDLSASALTDSDTVTSVDVYIRTRTSGGGNDNVDVDLLIGGTPQGTQANTGALTSSFADDGFLGTTQTWTTDYTAAQLAGMQVRITAQQAGMPESLGLEVSEIEVVVNYTVGNITREPLVLDPGLDLAGKVPTLFREDAVLTPPGGLYMGTRGLRLSGITPTIDVTSGDNHTRVPLVLDPGLDLAGKIPTSFREDVVAPLVLDPGLDLAGKIPALFREDIVAPPVLDPGLDLAGKIPTVLVNHITQPLVLDPGLDLTGKAPSVERDFFINVATEDGGLNLAGKIPTVLVNHITQPLVLDPGLDLTGKAPSVERDFFIDVAVEDGGLNLAGKIPTIIVDHIALPAVLDPGLDLAGQIPTSFREDVILPAVLDPGLDLVGKVPTVITNHITQPLVLDPGLDLTGKAPSIERDYFIDVAAGALTIAGKIPEPATGLFVPSGAAVLAGQAPAALVTLSAAPAAEALTLSGQAPTIVVDHITLPLVETLVLAGQAPTITQNLVRAPSEETLSLAGQIPTLLQDSLRTPGEEALVLSGKIPVVLAAGGAAPDFVALTLTGQAPTLTTPSVVTPDVVALTLSGKAPTDEADYFIDVTEGALTLAGQVPELVSVAAIVPPVGAVTLSGDAPSVEFSYTITVGAETLVLTGQELASSSAVAEPGAAALALESTSFFIITQPPIVKTPASASLVTTGIAPARAHGLVLRGFASNLVFSSPFPGKRALVLGSEAPVIVNTSVSPIVVTPPFFGRVLSTKNIALAISQDTFAASLQIEGWNPKAIASSPVFFPPRLGLLLSPAAPITSHQPEPTVGTLALAGQAPQLLVSTNYAPSPAAGVLTLTGQIPDFVADTQLFIPPTATLSVTEQSAFLGRSLSIPSVAKRLNRKTPVANVGINRVITPAAAVSTLTGKALVANVGDNISVAGTALSLTEYAPSIQRSVPAGVLSLTSYAPVSTLVSITVKPLKGSLSISTQLANIGEVAIKFDGARLKLLSLSEKRSIEHLFR